MRQFVIEKVLTHNIIMAKDNHNEYILIGKGIGFKKKPEMMIDEGEISSYYIIQNIQEMSEYEKIILNTADDILLATEKAIKHAEKALNHKFDQGIHISLLDHLNFAIYRLKNKIVVGSFLTDEYYLMYSDLYDIAHEMVDIINEALDITLEHSEVGAIILHLHAAINKSKVSSTALYVEVIAFALNYIQKHMNILDENSIAKARLITHLKFALKRMENKTSINNPLGDVIKEKYPEVYQVAKGLANEIDQNFNIRLPESEVCYIALHIYNMQF